MKTKARFFRLAVLSVLVAVPAFADAPSGQYANFDANATTVTDKQTGLIWQRTVLQTAEIFSLTKCTPPSRLPTVKELLSLVDEQPHKEYVGQAEQTLYIDGAAFGGTAQASGDRNTPVDAPYWTQTPGGGTKHFGLDFSTGQIDNYPDTTSLYVRCVTDKT